MRMVRIVLETNQHLCYLQRGYVFRQNPVVKVFPDAPGNSNFGLQLAINTNQFGRTFQDRYT